MRKFYLFFQFEDSDILVHTLKRDDAFSLGGVAERLNAPVLKTGRLKGLVGSNPTPSAIELVKFSRIEDHG